MNKVIRLIRLLPLLVALSAISATASASVVWVESVDGDLSSDPTAPTSIVFTAGINSVFGSVQAPGDVRDYITFTLADNQLLTGIFLRKYVDEDTGGPGNRGFHSLNLGAEGVIPGPGTADLLLGGDHLDPVGPGVNLLELLAAAPLAGTGFDTPLGAGTYTYLIQQTGPQLTGYQLDFVIKPVPLPMAGWLFLSGLAALLGLSRDRR